MKWMMNEIGMEKLVLKQGRGIGYFVYNRESEYKVLSYIQDHPNDSVLKEDRNKLVLTLNRIESIGAAIALLTRLLNKEIATTTQPQE